MTRPCVLLAAVLWLTLPAAYAQVPLYTFENSIPENYGFGTSSIGFPDIDGDAVSDFAIKGSRRIDVYSGATGEVIWSRPASAGDWFGRMDDVPDVDGDGIVDVAVSATGKVYVLSGATGDLFRTIWDPAPSNGYQSYGRVVGLPDIDGDGRGDLLIGSSGTDGAEQDEGAAYLHSGATGALLRTLTSPNPTRHGYFGWTVKVGDHDDDGLVDLFVSEKAGQGSYIFSSATGELLRTFDFSRYFTPPVAEVDDLDGDGYGDFLVGGTVEFSSDGAAAVFSSATGARIRSYESPVAGLNGSFGYSVAQVPDVDGDGHPDHLIGARSEYTITFGVGRAYVFSGVSGTLIGDLQSPNPQAYGRFGTGVSGIPDLDGDGLGELLVYASGEDSGGPTLGRVYIFSGGIAVPAEPGAEAFDFSLTVSPNPARDRAALTLFSDVAQSVRVVVFDALGRHVITLHDGPLAAGTHPLSVDTSRLPTGVYLVRVDADASSLSQRLTVVR